MQLGGELSCAGVVEPVDVAGQPELGERKANHVCVFLLDLAAQRDLERLGCHVEARDDELVECHGLGRHRLVEERLLRADEQAGARGELTDLARVLPCRRARRAQLEMRDDAIGVEEHRTDRVGRFAQLEREARSQHLHASDLEELLHLGAHLDSAALGVGSKVGSFSIRGVGRRPALLLDEALREIHEAARVVDEHRRPTRRRRFLHDPEDHRSLRPRRRVVECFANARDHALVELLDGLDGLVARDARLAGFERLLLRFCFEHHHARGRGHERLEGGEEVELKWERDRVAVEIAHAPGVQGSPPSPRHPTSSPGLVDGSDNRLILDAASFELLHHGAMGRFRFAGLLGLGLAAIACNEGLLGGSGGAGGANGVNAGSGANGVTSAAGPNGPAATGATGSNAVSASNAVSGSTQQSNAASTGTGLAGGPSSDRLTLRPIGTMPGAPLGYAEYLPPGYGDGNPRPILFFHHGISESGNGSEGEVVKVLNTGMTALIANDQWPDDRPFIVLASQHDAPPGTSCHSVEEIDTFITWALTQYDVDLSRVYLTGLSCGAIGSWNYLGAHTNEVVAAAVLIAGDGQSAFSQAGCELAKIPIWAFHGELDGTVPPAGSINTMNWINACTNPAPVDARLTTYPGEGHNVWDETYNLDAGHDVYGFMLGYTHP